MFPLPEITREPRVIEPEAAMEIFPILAVPVIFAFPRERFPILAVPDTLKLPTMIFPLVSPVMIPVPSVMFPEVDMDIFPILAIWVILAFPVDKVAVEGL